MSKPRSVPVGNLPHSRSPTGSSLKIVEPAEGAKLTAGKTVTTNVGLGKDSGIIQVRYYWYGEQDDTLVEQEDATAMGRSLRRWR